MNVKIIFFILVIRKFKNNSLEIMPNKSERENYSVNNNFRSSLEEISNFKNPISQTYYEGSSNNIFPKNLSMKIYKNKNNEQENNNQNDENIIAFQQ